MWEQTTRISIQNFSCFIYCKVEPKPGVGPLHWFRLRPKSTGSAPLQQASPVTPATLPSLHMRPAPSHFTRPSINRSVPLHAQPVLSHTRTSTSSGHFPHTPASHSKLPNKASPGTNQAISIRTHHQARVYSHSGRVQCYKARRPLIRISLF